MGWCDRAGGGLVAVGVVAVFGVQAGAQEWRRAVAVVEGWALAGLEGAGGQAAGFGKSGKVPKRGLKTARARGAICGEGDGREVILRSDWGHPRGRKNNLENLIFAPKLNFTSRGKNKRSVRFCPV